MLIITQVSIWALQLKHLKGLQTLFILIFTLVRFLMRQVKLTVPKKPIKRANVRSLAEVCEFMKAGIKKQVIFDPWTYHEIKKGV